MSGVQHQSFRLNEMQSLMRRCSKLAPYNFIHALRMAVPADGRRWRDAAEQTVAELGLGAPRFDGDRVRFVSAFPVSVETPQGSLDNHLDSEMNRPFSSDELPFRFFVIEEADGTHWFGVVIDHWLADDYSCRQLLHRICLRYYSPEKAVTLPVLECADAPSQRHFRTVLRALPGLAKQFASHRRAVRVSLRDPLDFAVRTFQQKLPIGLIDTIRRRAKEYNATVHDCFLMAAAQACGEFRRSHFRGPRQSIAVATVVDLRRFVDRGIAMATAFGCFLGYYTLAISNPEESPALGLIKGIALRTKLLKTQMRGTQGALILARIWWDHSRSDCAKATLFQRGIPLMCGLSNVNLTGSWIDGTVPRLLDYRRVGPTGPITPLVFMITSISDRLSIDVTYRTTAFTQGDAEFLADRFITRLNSLVA